MSRLAWLRRILLRTLSIFVVLAVVALVVARFYLRSRSAAQLVQEQIQLALGAPVELDEAEIHFWGDSSVSHLRLIDPGDDRPFLEAGQAVADLSVLGYLRGRTAPRRIDLNRANLRLRFDANGSLLTKLPAQPAAGGALPAVRIRASSLTLEQEGRPPFTLEGLSLTLQPTKPNNLFGILDDSVWGTFDVGGRVDPSGAFTITLDNKGVALTPAMLQSLPFVPPALWTTLEADGPSVPLTFTLAVGTRAPWVSYTVAFDRARVRLLQPDRAPLTASPARAVLDGNEDGFKLEGVVHDAYWGEWTVAAGLVAPTGAVTVDLATRDAVVDQKKLEALPYVPKNVWKQVQASGRTPAHVRVSLFTNKPDVHYRVELHPRDTRVRVASINLEAENAAGEVVVEDSRVLLRKVTGRTAGGDLATSGDLDFRRDPLRLQFDVNVHGLVLKQLPKQWNLPGQLEGKVSGQANLTVMVRDGAPETHGAGKGRIDEAKLAGFRVKEPIELNLAADGRTFRFVPRSPLLQILMLTPSARLAPPAGRARNGKQDGRQPPTSSSQRGAGSKTEPSPRLQPARLVGEAVSDLGKVATWVVAGASLVLTQAARIDRPPPAGAKPTYLDAKVGLDDVDLAELAKRLGLDLPIELTGRLSFQMTIGIPINTARDFKTYRLHGTAAMSTLVVSVKGQAGLPMNKVSAEVDYANGLLRLDKLSGELPGPGGKVGSFNGSAQAQVLPQGDLMFDLAVRNLPVDRIVRALPGLAGKASGDLSGTVRGGAALDRLLDPTRWRGTASVRVPQLEVYGLTLRNASATATVFRGLASLSDVAGELHGGPLSGSLTLSLTGARRFQGDLRIRGLDVGQLPLAWSGQGARGAVEASAELHGTLQPLTLAGAGKVRAATVRFAGVPVEKLDLAWAVADEKLKVSEFTAAIARGKATGTAEVPLAALGFPPPRANAAKVAGRLDLRIADVDLHVLAAASRDLPFRVSGLASGMLKGSYAPPAKEGEQGTWAGEVDFSAATLKLQDVPVQKLRGRLEYRGGKAEYRLDGETLGGKLTIEGKLPPPPMSSVGRFDGRLRLERALLSRLWRPLGLGESLGKLHGVLTVDLPFRHEGPSMTPVGQGRFEVRSLRWQGSEAAESIRGDVRLTAEGVFVRDLAADLAGGLLRFGLSYRWRDASRNWFTVSVSQAEVGRLLVFEGDSSEMVKGPIDLHLRGTLGGEWRGAGSVEMTRGKVLGVEVSDLRLPVDFTFVPRRGRGELTVREAHAQVGQGRAQLQTSINWGGSMRVEGNLRLFEASLRTLGGLLGDVSQYAQGRVTGHVEFGGGEVRSINDVTATAQAKLKEAQALQLPILNLVVPFLPGQGALTFRDGDFKARLAGGVWRIEQMTLESPAAHLIVQGTLTVQGRLDLDVVAHTSSLGGLNPLLLRGLLARIPPIGPVPVGLIFQATELLSNRIFRLHISGTTKTPRITFEPIRALSEEAVRFFLTRTLIPAR